MPQHWYIESDGSVDGPLSSKELRERAASGRLRPGDRVSPDRTTWIPAATVAELAFPPGESRSAEVTADPEEPLLPGYEVLTRIGAGACGVVYRARQLKLDRPVAVKTFATDRAVSSTQTARFEREAVALARLRHPNIVQVYDTGRVDGRVFIAMELLDGEDLDRRIARAGRLDERTGWWIARQTALALAHAAEKGISHRDVKPANLFLTDPPLGFGLPPGVPMVKVTDFGLAHTTRAEEGEPAERLTAVGVIVGTPVYMAPEQFTRSDVDHRADIYSLGATLYHAFTGRPPFEAPTVWDVMSKKIQTVPRLGPPISPESADLVAAMLENDPSKRIRDYEQLIARIDALPALGSGFRPKPSAGRPGRRNAWAAAAGVFFLGLVWFLVFRPHSRSEVTIGPPPSTAGYETTGVGEELFDGKSVLGWSGRGWAKEYDEEKTPVISGTGLVRRRYPMYSNHRFLLGLDLHTAATTEAYVAVFEGPAEAAPRLVVRVSRTGTVFGRKAGDNGFFEEIGVRVPYPSAEELEGKPPYQELRCEKVGKKWAAWFRGRLLGETEVEGDRLTNEFRVFTEGGSVRIDSARVEELRPKS